LIFGTNTELLGLKITVQQHVTYQVDFIQRMDLGEGIYHVGAALHRGTSHLETCYHWRDDVTQFEINGNLGHYFIGTTKLYPMVIGEIVPDYNKKGEGVHAWLPLGAEDKQTLISHVDPLLIHVCSIMPKLTDFSARVDSLCDLKQMTAGEIVSAPFRVKNLSSEPWPSKGQRPVRFCYHWLDQQGNMVIYDGVRTALPKDISGGTEIIVMATIQAPEQPGDYVLQATLVQEGITWFEENGMHPFALNVRVNPF
jgi:hypothetical protein